MQGDRRPWQTAAIGSIGGEKKNIRADGQPKDWCRVSGFDVAPAEFRETYGGQVCSIFSHSQNHGDERAHWPNMHPADSDPQFPQRIGILATLPSSARRGNGHCGIWGTTARFGPRAASGFGEVFFVIIDCSDE